MTAQKNKKNFFFLGVFALLGLALAVISFGRETLPLLRVFKNPLYLHSIKFILIIAFALFVIKWITKRFPSRPWLKWIYGILFLPLLLLPLFRCYFKIPYIFCRVCPNRCPWGLVRTFAFNSFLLLNLFGKSWCSSLCPFGTFQECQTSVSKKRFILPVWISIVMSYVILLLVTVMYFSSLFGWQWGRFFELGRYAWVDLTVIISLTILLVSFLVPKFWCRYFCPVGTIAELTSAFRFNSQKPGTAKN